jgi:quercetin dioxygenase-like cupin family protein
MQRLTNVALLAVATWAVPVTLVLVPVSPLAAETVAPVQAKQVDALTASPENFRLVLENDTVRVLEYTLLPGKKDHQHTHPRRVAHVMSGGTLRVGFPDGTSMIFEEKAGESSWSEPSPLHDTENIGTTPIRILLVETKQGGSK